MSFTYVLGPLKRGRTVLNMYMSILPVFTPSQCSYKLRETGLGLENTLPIVCCSLLMYSA